MGPIFLSHSFQLINQHISIRQHAVVQVVLALLCKSEGLGFDFDYVTLIFY